MPLAAPPNTPCPSDPDQSHTPRVAVFTLGGTIAMTRAQDGSITPSLSGAALMETVPGLANVAEIELASPLQMPGASLTIPHILLVASKLRDSLAAGADGAIIVQGTDTIEETAFVLDSVLGESAPVVVTGAMRGPEAAGADGPANVLAAAIVAASGKRNTGVTVVMGDTVHAARFVRKGHTGLPDAFTSAPFGPVGHVIEGRFRHAVHLPHRAKLNPAPDTRIPPVALLQIGLGDDARMLGRLAESGYQGAVVAAMGAGHVPQALAKPLGALARQMPVILSSRVSGPVFECTYGFEGSEVDLLGRGLISGTALGPLKARLLLQIALGCGYRDPEQIRTLFSHHD
jgi:L-asparaginase